MAWRSVVIANPARLRLDQSQLVIEREGLPPATLPVEDIAVLVVEAQQVSLTAPLLCALAANESVVLFCDARHTPQAASLPICGHHRMLKVQRLQLESTLPLRKRCWQAVVQRKIRNQALALQYSGRPDAEAIHALAEAVTSGDRTNQEAQASRLYFPLLFDPAFTRDQPCGWNSALNYGYAVLRAAVARSVAAHGLLPAHGLHHHSELNAFNLADDLLEPFRPLVDLAVACDLDRWPDAPELTQDQRMSLVELLHHEVEVDGNRQAVLHAVELLTASLVSAFTDADPKRLKLPLLLPLRRHPID